MKKILTAIILIAILSLSVGMLASCGDKDDTVKVESIYAEVQKNTAYKLEDTFDKSTIVLKAKMSDGKEKTFVDNSVAEFDVSALKLVNNKFTEKGDFDIKITFLRHSTTLTIKVI